MKTFNEIITEFFRESDKAKRKFMRVVKDIDTTYPGVNAFFFSASKWAHEVSPSLDRELYKLLEKLQHRKNIEDLSQQELRMVYKFLKKRKLDTVDDMEELFIEATKDDIYDD